MAEDISGIFKPEAKTIVKERQNWMMAQVRDVLGANL